MNVKQLMIDNGMNPFGLDLFVESFLKSQMAGMVFDKGEALNIAYPVNRSDCKEWLGVQITLMPIKNETATKPEV